MYNPLPKSLTIKKSPIEGLGLYATENIKSNCFIGLTHVKDKNFENGYIRTPLGGFYNHSNNPNVRRVISDELPKLKCGDPIDESLDVTKIPDGKANRENLYPNVEGKYMFLVATKDIKSGEEITANATTEAQSIVQAARRKAYSLLNDAEASAATQREGADRYSTEVLAGLEEKLAEVLSQVRRGIDTLRPEENTSSPRNGVSV